MIRAEFVIRDNNFLSFSVEGHAGLAPAPHDVLCAGVSAMTMLVLNTLNEVFEAELDLDVQEEDALIFARLVRIPQGREEAVQGVIRGLYLQLKDLQEQYPDHLTVRTKK